MSSMIPNAEALEAEIRGGTPWTIPARFQGPDDCGNGGYVCGRLAAAIAGPRGAIEATLRRPVPLERELRLVSSHADVRLFDGKTLVADAHRTHFSVYVPNAVTVAAARRACEASSVFDPHPFPRCFVCGPGRESGDGLRLAASPVGTDGIVAAPWAPDDSFGETPQGSHGLRLLGAKAVALEFVAAALDCPGGYAWAAAIGPRPMVLGRFAFEVVDPPTTGRDYVVLGWPLETQGRKRFAGTALIDDQGRTRAVAKATWIEISRPQA